MFEAGDRQLISTVVQMILKKNVWGPQKQKNNLPLVNRFMFKLKTLV